MFSLLQVQGRITEVVSSCETHPDAVPKAYLAYVRAHNETRFSLRSKRNESVERGGHGRWIVVMRASEDVAGRRPC